MSARANSIALARDEGSEHKAAALAFLEATGKFLGKAGDKSGMKAALERVVALDSKKVGTATKQRVFSEFQKAAARQMSDILSEDETPLVQLRAKESARYLAMKAGTFSKMGRGRKPKHRMTVAYAQKAAKHYARIAEDTTLHAMPHHGQSCGISKTLPCGNGNLISGIGAPVEVGQLKKRDPRRRLKKRGKK